MQVLAKAGKTIVFTTHYLPEAEELAQRIVVIDPRPRDRRRDAPGSQVPRVPARRVTFSNSASAACRGPRGTGGDKHGGLDRRVRLLTNDPESLLRRALPSGVEISSLEVVGADLEEAFLTLTRPTAGP